MGYEALACGNRCASFNHQRYNYDYKYNTSGPFWNQNRKLKTVFLLLNKVLSYKTNKWIKIHKKYSNQILIYDKKNKSKKKIIQKIL